MARISWLILCMLFYLIFMLFCPSNYYSYMSSSPKSNELKNIDFNSMYWKW